MVLDLNSTLSYLLQDAVGWFVVPVTFAIPLLSEQIRKNQTLMLACWFAIFLHQAAAITNCYLFTLPGCDNDAFAMQAAAVNPGTRPNLDLLPYVIALRYIYDSVGVSQFLGSQLSIVSFATCLLMFVDLCLLIETRVKPALLVLLFTCWPITIINTSVTLRESYQVLAVLCIGWSLMALRGKQAQPKAYPILVAGIVMVFNLHRGLVFYSLAMAGVAYMQLARNTMAILLSAALVLGVMAGGFLANDPKQSAFSRLSGGFDVGTAVTYRDNITGGRASYNVVIDTKSVPGFFLSVSLCFILYMFAPLPWMASGLPDLYALLESVFRMFLVGGMIANVRESQGDRRSKLMLMVILFLSLEFLWSLGTSNWGQAIRHRAVGYAFLVILGGDWWLARLSRRMGMQGFREPQNNGLRLKAT